MYAEKATGRLFSGRIFGGRYLRLQKRYQLVFLGKDRWTGIFFSAEKSTTENPTTENPTTENPVKCIGKLKKMVLVMIAPGPDLILSSPYGSVLSMVPSP